MTKWKCKSLSWQSLKICGAFGGESCARGDKEVINSKITGLPKMETVTSLSKVKELDFS